MARLAGTSARRRPARTALAVVGCLALLAAIDLGVGVATVPDLPPVSEEPEPDGPVLNAPDVAAGDGEPWAGALYPELGEAYGQAEYHPYRGWSIPDYRGDWVIVEDEVRLSYETALAGPAVDVFFFGGSTMMGWVQRNEHTIPSEVVRLAEADGIAVKAFNYGQPAYSHWQEVMLLQELVSEGKVPDLAVFYDGANELGAQFRSGPSQDPIHLQARAIQERLDEAKEARSGVERVPAPRRLLDAYLETSALARVYRSSPVAEVAQAVTSDDSSSVGPLWPNQAERPRDPWAGGGEPVPPWGRPRPVTERGLRVPGGVVLAADHLLARRGTRRRGRRRFVGHRPGGVDHRLRGGAGDVGGPGGRPG